MKILIITLYYEPLNNIATSRIKAFKKYLTEFGHEVDILTRHYNEELLKKSSLLIADTPGDEFDGDYYVKNKVVYTKYKTKNSKLDISNKLPRGLKGLYNYYQIDVFHYGFLEYGYKAYQSHFSNRPHDIIIGSSPSLISVRLAKKIGENFNIPWVADFRDSYITGDESNFIFKTKAVVLNKLLNGCSGICFVSDGLKDINEKVLSKKNREIPSEIIYNGYSNDNSKIDQEIIQQFNSIKDQAKLTLLYTGSLYKELNLDFFLKGLDQYNNNNVIALIMVGIQNEFVLKIKEDYPNLNLHFIPKVSHSTAIELQKRADFLLLNIWKGRYSGFSGKVFEYLHSNTQIILDKAPPSDLEEFLKEYKNIHYCNEKIETFNKIIGSNTETFTMTATQRNKLERKHQVDKLNSLLSCI